MKTKQVTAVLVGVVIAWIAGTVEATTLSAAVSATAPAKATQPIPPAPVRVVTPPAPVTKQQTAPAAQPQQAVSPSKTPQVVQPKSTVQVGSPTNTTNLPSATSKPQQTVTSPLYNPFPISTFKLSTPTGVQSSTPQVQKGTLASPLPTPVKPQSNTNNMPAIVKTPTQPQSTLTLPAYQPFVSVPFKLSTPTGVQTSTPQVQKGALASPLPTPVKSGSPSMLDQVVNAVDSKATQAVKTVNSEAKQVVKTVDSDAKSVAKTVGSEANQVVKTVDSDAKSVVKTLPQPTFFGQISTQVPTQPGNLLYMDMYTPSGEEKFSVDKTKTYNAANKTYTTSVDVNTPVGEVIVDRTCNAVTNKCTMSVPYLKVSYSDYPTLSASANGNFCASYEASSYNSLLPAPSYTLANDPFNTFQDVAHLSANASIAGCINVQNGSRTITGNLNGEGALLGNKRALDVTGGVTITPSTVVNQSTTGPTSNNK